MDTSTRKAFFHKLQSNPRWIDHVVPMLQAENGEGDTAKDSPFELVESVVNILLSAVAQYDSKFSFQPVDASSFFTEKERNHFELLLFLSPDSLRPAEIRLQQEGCSPGVTLVEVIQNTHTLNTWKSECSRSSSGQEYLSSKMLRNAFSNLLSILLTDMLYLQLYHNKTTRGIEVRNISSDNEVRVEIDFRGLILTVDLLTAIDCEGLLPIHTYPSKGKKLGHKRNSPSKRKTVNCGIQLVSKATSVEYHWRIWYCKAERFELDFKRFPQRWESFQLFKTLVYKKLGCNFLKPYLLQTVLLHECAKFSDVDQWTEEKLPSRFHGLVEVLESFARDKNCPHFFIPSLNLFTEISNEYLKGLCRKIKFIRERCGKVKGQESFLEKD